MSLKGDPFQEWVKQELQRLAKLGDSRQSYLMDQISRLNDAVTTLCMDRERPKMREELRDWRRSGEIIQWDHGPKPDRFIYMARYRLLELFEKQKLLEEKHQGRGRPILYRWKEGGEDKSGVVVKEA